MVGFVTMFSKIYSSNESHTNAGHNQHRDGKQQRKRTIFENASASAMYIVNTMTNQG